MTFQKEETVRVTFKGKTVKAELLLTDAASLSLLLVLDECLGPYAVAMPVVWMDEHYVDLLAAQPVSICPLSRS